MFTPKWKKQATLLYKGSQKFLNYKRDLLDEDRIKEINSRRDDLKKAIKSKDKEQAKEAGKMLEKTCEQSLPRYRGNNALQENLEVIFVAIVVALGIRAYFLQPFRIPTNSMYPTLNGVTGQSVPKDQWPALPIRLAQEATHGRSYFSIKTKSDCYITSVTDQTKLHFFSRGVIKFSDGYSDSISGSGTAFFQAGLTKLLDKLLKEQHPQYWYKPSDQYLSIRAYPEQLRSSYYSAPRDTLGGKNLLSIINIPAGTTIAEGYSQSGDLILVDKMSYHFRKPTNGEVFVFDVRGIEDIQKGNRRAKKEDSHYIKRLIASPGDSLRFEKAKLNPKKIKEGYKYGEVIVRNNAYAKEPGILRVQSLEGKFNGYGSTDAHTNFRGLKMYSKPSSGLSHYWAMGDNSYNSGDSRKWGPVREFNVVGPAFLSLWPFGSGHWGVIK